MQDLIAAVKGELTGGERLEHGNLNKRLRKLLGGNLFQRSSSKCYRKAVGYDLIWRVWGGLGSKKRFL